MLPTDHLVAFLLTVYVLIVIPGPSVLFTISRGVSLGRRAALATVLGNTSGLIVQLVLVAVGLGAVLARSDAVYTVLKLIGAAYLVLLGIRSIRDRKQLAGVLRSRSAQPRSLVRTIREGFMVGLTNPKGVLIFTAVLPQFIDRSRGHYTLQLLSLGLLCAVVALLSDSAWAIASGTARDWLGRSPRRLERLSIAGGISMIALGAGLALTGRRNENAVCNARLAGQAPVASAVCRRHRSAIGRSSIVPKRAIGCLADTSTASSMSAQVRRLNPDTGSVVRVRGPCPTLTSPSRTRTVAVASGGASTSPRTRTPRCSISATQASTSGPMVARCSGPNSID